MAVVTVNEQSALMVRTPAKVPLLASPVLEVLVPETFPEASTSTTPIAPKGTDPVARRLRAMGLPKRSRESHVAV